ncbi:MAG: flavodoxin family protein [Acidaminococcaceae bacterium]|nr:flavodoxin family protein [Acidaminococcaceae bacterium]MDD4722609.1 flavodoxin family protein [Acidaminococcaceae bacterium]
MKKILGICVSPRKNGNSSIILNELLRPAREIGYQTEVLNLGTAKILPCNGCLSCTNSSYKCILKDDLEQVKEKIESADAIALASPCYYLSTPAILKAVMDRSAAWAINKMATGGKKKYGVAVSVAGGNPFEFSLQRIYSSLFLKLYNCEIVGQFTIGNSFNKGEVLLVPSKLKSVNELGKNLVQSLEKNCCQKSKINENSSKLACPQCFNDVFQIYKNGSLICPVCGTELKKPTVGKPKNILNRFSLEGANEHRSHIIDNITGKILAGDEINRRLKAYWDSDILPEENYQIDYNLEDVINLVTWDNEALGILSTSVPPALQEVIKKAITKKAFQKGESAVTKITLRKYMSPFFIS